MHRLLAIINSFQIKQNKPIFKLIYGPIKGGQVSGMDDG